MSVIAVRRLLFLCVAVGVLLAGCFSARADGQADGLARVKQLIADKDYAGAIAILAPIASSTGPVPRQVKEDLETCYRLTKDWLKAVPVIESLQQEYPSDTALWKAHLSACYLGTGDRSKCVAVAKESLDATPRAPEVTRLLAHNLWACYSETKDWDDAMSLYRSLLTRQPQEAATWHYQLGRCHRVRNETTEAIASLERAMELGSSDPEDMIRIGPELARAYRDIKDFEKAQAVLKKCQEQHPSYSAVWRQHLKAARTDEAYWAKHITSKLQNKGRYDEAIEGFRKVIERYPDCEDTVESAHVCIAECHVGRGKPDEAMDYAKKLYDEQPAMRGAALLGMGMASFHSGNYDDAATALQRLASEYPGNMHADMGRSFRVEVLERAGRIDEAVEVLRALASRESDPAKKAPILLRVAGVYQEAKRHRDAIKAFKEVRTLKDAPDETKAEATYRSGLCYHEIGYDSSARRCMEEVMKRYSDTRWASQARGGLHVWSAYPDEAH